MNSARPFEKPVKSDDGKAGFWTNPAAWRCFKPADLQRWWRVDPRVQSAAAKRGDRKYLRMAAAEGRAVEPIWGAGSPNSYLFYVVTPKDLAGAAR